MGEETLAKQVYLEQKLNDWPGLSKEVTMICEELGIEDVNSSSIQKNALRKELEKACRLKDEKELKEKMGKKMVKLKSEDCQRKEYMELKCLADVRNIFRVRTNMVEGFRGSFQNMYENTSLNCVGCGLVVDYQAHSMECPSYEDLREGLDMERDLDLVTFFRKVMDRRNEE